MNETSANEAQREFWNGAAGDVWVEAQIQMDAMLKPISDLGLAKAAATSAERVIDIGCGCGDTTLALAEAGASVWGLDISENMLAHAKARKGDRENVAFSVGDAATQAYTPDHDLVFSRFGVMFFDDPKAAFQNIRTGLKPDGRLVFLCWQSPKENLWMSVAGRAARPFLPPPEQSDPRAPGPFAFADPEWIKEILDAAGYSNINVESVTPDLKVGDTVEDAMYFQGRIGPMARALADLDEDKRAQAMQAVRDALSEYQSDKGVWIKSAGWLVSATNT